MKNDPILMIYMTCANHAEATRIAQILVEEKLAACVNIMQPMTSHYSWEGALRQTSEVPVFAKTLKSKFESLSARVTELHSYDIPCIVALQPEAISDLYSDWLRAAVD
jgi:periplasmic divalent cation tolerance protein